MSHEPRTIDLTRAVIPAGSGWSRLPLIALTVGAIGIIGSLLLRVENPKQFSFSWLVAFLFFLSMGLGALFFVLVHFATKAGWGIVVRRLAENVMGTLPLFLLLVIPVLFFGGIDNLFEWSHEDVVAQDELIAGKTPYLNKSFFLGRAAVYLVCWSVLAWFFRSRSVKQDANGDHALTRLMTRVSGPGILIFALTLTFAAFDWIMSLDAHWYSTIFGVYYFAGSLVAIYATLALLAAALNRSGYLAQAVSSEHFHDLGKLLFAFTVFWTYIGFSQFFLIWYGNIPEETIWYLHRMNGDWMKITICLAFGHFVIPFFFLMSRHIKRRTPLLVLGALWMLAMHLLDLYWLVMPTLHHDVHFSWLDVTTLLGVGGIFFAVLFWLMGRQPLLPIGDPRLAESLTYDNS